MRYGFGGVFGGELKNHALPILLMPHIIAIQGNKQELCFSLLLKAKERQLCTVTRLFQRMMNHIFVILLITFFEDFPIFKTTFP